MRYVLLSALRDRLFVALMAAVIGAAFLASVVGSTAFLEEREMTVALAAAATRLLLVVGLVLFITFHLRSAFDTREIDVMLSRPISRTRLVLAFWGGFVSVAALLVAAVSVVIALLHPLSTTGLALWALSLLLESWLVVALALFAAFTLRSAVSSALAALGVYVLARMMAFFAQTGAHYAHDSNPLLVGASHVLSAVSMLTPRLDFFGQSSWLIYGVLNAAEWQRVLLQAAIFIPLLLVASVLDFRRRQF